VGIQFVVGGRNVGISWFGAAFGHNAGLQGAECPDSKPGVKEIEA